MKRMGQWVVVMIVCARGALGCGSAAEPAPDPRVSEVAQDLQPCLTGGVCGGTGNVCGDDGVCRPTCTFDSPPVELGGAQAQGVPIDGHCPFSWQCCAGTYGPYCAPQC